LTDLNSVFLALPDLFCLLIVGVECYPMHLISLSLFLSPPHTCAYTHTHTHTHLVWLLWTRGRPVAETSTWQHSIQKRHSFPRWDSNPHSQQTAADVPFRLGGH